jgi:Resolvase, N terminal domain
VNEAGLLLEVMQAFWVRRLLAFHSTDPRMDPERGGGGKLVWCLVAGDHMTSPAYGSPVVGYIRSAQLNDPELDVLEEHIQQYAKEHGYNLVKTFREQGISSVAVWRPELEKLIRGLERHGWVGVVVPDDSHWSARSAVAKRIQERVEGAGGWTAIIRVRSSH